MSRFSCPKSAFFLQFFEFLIFSLASNKAGEMVKAIGKFEPRVVEIKKIFGLDYHKLKWGEKRFLWQVYVQRTELTYFEKRNQFIKNFQKKRKDSIFTTNLISRAKSSPS